MPRNGAGAYTRPPGLDGVPNATIESADWNLFVADVEQDLNTPRPIVAGGTGAGTAAQARINLGAMSLTGDTMTGPLFLSPPTGNASITLNKPLATGNNFIVGTMATLGRWVMNLGDGTNETGANVGSNFVLERYNDAGLSLGNAMTINRATGVAAFLGQLVVGGTALPSPLHTASIHVGVNLNLVVATAAGAVNLIACNDNAGAQVPLKIDGSALSINTLSNGAVNFGTGLVTIGGALIAARLQALADQALVGLTVGRYHSSYPWSLIAGDATSNGLEFRDAASNVHVQISAGTAAVTRVTMFGTQASSSPATGALVVTGGVGIGGALNVGGLGNFNGASIGNGATVGIYCDATLMSIRAPGTGSAKIYFQSLPTTYGDWDNARLSVVTPLVVGGAATFNGTVQVTTVGIGFGAAPNATNTPQIYYSAPYLAFTRWGAGDCLLLNLTTNAATFGGAVNAPSVFIAGAMFAGFGATKQHINFDPSGEQGISIAAQAASQNGAYVSFAYGGAVTGHIKQTPGGGGIAYNTTSDARGKPNRERLSPSYAREIVDALELYDFDKDGNDIRGVGWLAQQARSVHKSFGTPGRTKEEYWMSEKAAPMPFVLANTQLNNQRLDRIERQLGIIQ